MIEYEKSFPFENIRDQQAEAIEFCLSKITSENKRFCIIEAGTGVGKSAIGLTLARVIADRYPSSEDFLSGAYFLTTQKILQQQYVDDFPSVVSLKSSSNYKCRYHKANTCAESQKMLKAEDKSSRFFKTCTFGCRYKEQKERFLESAESVSNFSYFLTEANYSGKITPRQTLVIDEGHNVETELSKFVEVTVSEHFASSVLKIKFPTKLTQHQTYIWIRDTYLPTAKRRLKYFEDTIEKFGGDKMREKLKQFQTITKQYDLLRGHIGKIKSLLRSTIVTIGFLTHLRLRSVDIGRLRLSL